MQTEGFRELVRQARAGDARAREELFARTLPYVDRVVHSQFLPPGESVSDRVQDVCLRVFEKLDQFRGADEEKSDDDTWGLFRGWVRQVVRTVSLNALRARDEPKRPQRRLSLQTPDATGSTSRTGALDPSAHERSPSSNVQKPDTAEPIAGWLCTRDSLADYRSTTLKACFFKRRSKPCFS